MKTMMCVVWMMLLSLEGIGQNTTLNNQNLGFANIADISEGRVAHWSFDNDTYKAVIDETLNGINGTPYNITYENGPVGKAALFNGNNSRVLFHELGIIPVDTIGMLGAGSISVWFKFQNLGGDILPILYFGETDVTKPHNSLIIEIGHAQNLSNRKLYFTIVNQRFCFDSQTDLEEDTWYHFVAIVSSTGNTGYLNGVEMTNRNYNLGSDSRYTDFFADVPEKKMLSLGYGRYGLATPFYPFKGSIDEVMIYNRALTSGDVEELYSAGFISGITESHANTNVLDLRQNSPNPFSRETKISWVLKEDCDTVLEIINIQGKIIKTVVDEYLSAGFHEAILNGESLSPGIYCVRLSSGGIIKTKKMILK